MSILTNWGRTLKLIAVPLALGTLAACATPFNAEVQRFQSALPAPQGQTFAVVVVKRHITDNRHEAAQASQGFSRCFPGMPIILMSQDSRGTPTYFGRRDLANFLSRVSMNRIPWKRYTFN